MKNIKSKVSQKVALELRINRLKEKINVETDPKVKRGMIKECGKLIIDLDIINYL